MRLIIALFAFFIGLALQGPTFVHAEPLPREEIEKFVTPPYALGEPLNENGVWSLLNSGGAEAGYVFETEPLAPLPGFSGAPLNIMVMLDLEGRFIDIKLISHNEPIFVSGLGEAPLRAFLEQYQGLSINTPMVVGVPYGHDAGGTGVTYLDGVLKATASVRIAHESIMAATLAVAREKMQGIQASPPARPNRDYSEDMTWQQLLEEGIARHLVVTNAELEAAFAGAIWAHDDPEAAADPEGLYLDLWLVDIGAPSVAKAVLDDEALADLERFLTVTPDAEPLLLIERARHGLVSEDFVRNTAPDLLGAIQDGLPIELRDADMIFDTLPEVPEGVAMILRVDRRLGFDPTREWDLQVKAVRAHGMFQPELGYETFALTYAAPERFYLRDEIAKPRPAWVDALYNRQGDMIALAIFLPLLFLLLGPGMNRLADNPRYTAIRLVILAAVLGFIGWWGQGQLSIVTPLAVLRTVIDGGAFAYLLYDPFSLLIWVATIIGFVLWGRGLFCGWLCPFGAMQEFTHHLGRLLRLPKWEPSAKWDERLKMLKYALLAGLVAAVFLTPDRIDKLVEVEPFKTAITTFFVRNWYCVVYAAFWLVLGMLTFKGFCRYVCPLGALMSIGGLLRGPDWIKRRKECGSPCQLCKVRCNYGAIKPSGDIVYSECFQCLDCVSIYNDPKTCVPLVLKSRGKELHIPKAKEVRQ
ncbi:4Fe-4S binding protein [Marivivens donghaensis]|uniref:4Fe-4S binding protein n=1 Tax=Marivivens donghaensis TaxID=1699413 RepID=A0ABX0W3G9_9RHOB|nr:4Fe-4S binding protein [Marivivens donghaensis]NIY73482.1 4Fe-4S binding protein [Marivivens donghaensis]